MIRFAVISDQHFDISTRFEETIRVFDWIAEDVRKRDVSAILLGGDLMERRSVPEDRNAAMHWLLKLADVAEVVAVYGNHDYQSDLLAFNHLEARHRITFYDQPAVHELPGVGSVACLPWPRRANLLAAIGQPVDGEQANQIAAQALRNVLLGLGTQMDSIPGVRGFLGHVSLRGGKVSTERTLIPGTDFELGSEDIGLTRADFMALGHLHEQQEVKWKRAPIFYPGSAVHRNFGETSHRKYAVVSVENGAATVEYLVTPATAMMLYEAEWNGEKFIFSGKAPRKSAVIGAEIRFRFRVQPDQQDAAWASARELEKRMREDGAVRVKIEKELIASTRARAPELSSAVGIPQKLEVYWKSKQIEIDDARRERLLGKVAELRTDEGAPHAAGSLTFKSIRMQGLIPFPHPVEVDFDAIQGRVIAVTGRNGQGKSTLLECMAGALYRKTATRGPLTELAIDRSAFVEVDVVNGSNFRIRQTMDAISRTGESLVVNDAGEPQFESSKVRDFDGWAAKHLPTSDVLYASTFAHQTSGGLLKMNGSERKSVILRAIGGEWYETLAQLASKRENAERVKFETTVARIADERDRSGDIETATEQLTQAESNAKDLDTSLDIAKANLEAAQQKAEQIRIEIEARKAAMAQRDALSIEYSKAEGEFHALDARIGAAEEQHRKATSDLVEAGELVEFHQDKLVRAESHAAELRLQIAEHTRRVAEREQTEKELREIAATLDGPKGLVARIANNQKILSQKDAIEHAAETMATLDKALASLPAEIERARSDARAVATEIGQLERSVADLFSAQTRAEQRVTAATAKLATLSDVTPAQEMAPRLREELQAIEDRGTSLAERIQKLQHATLNVAGRRIESLRGALGDIAHWDDDGAPPSQIATVALESDDQTAEQAKTAPAELKEATEKLETVRKQRASLQTRLAETERLAARAGELTSTEEDLQASKADAAEAKEKHASTTAKLAKVRASRDLVDGAVRTLEGRQSAATAERVKVADLAKKAPHLTTAETRIAELTPQVERLSSRRLDLQTRLVDPDGGPIENPDALVKAAKDRVAAAEKAASDLRIAMTAAETRIAELEPQKVAAKVRMGELEEQIKAVVIPPSPDTAPEPIVHAAKSLVIHAEAEARVAHGEVAVATARLETARLAERKLAELETERAQLETDLADWKLLSESFGKNGLQALEVDAAGPELTSLVNDFLHSCHGPRWTVTIDTTRTSKDGSKQIEDCDITILDAEEGTCKRAERLSEGQGAIVGEAVRLALSVLACRSSSVHGASIIRDETGAPLDAENGRAYLKMLRRAADIVEASHVIFVTHSAEIAELADARIIVENGTIRVAA